MLLLLSVVAAAPVSSYCETVWLLELYIICCRATTYRWAKPLSRTPYPAALDLFLSKVRSVMWPWCWWQWGQGYLPTHWLQSNWSYESCRSYSVSIQSVILVMFWSNWPLCPVCSFGFSTAINAYRGFGYTCSGNEGFISNCTASPFTCITDDADHAIAIQCGL